MSQTAYRASLAKRRGEVSAMFDGVAARYDVMNDLMTLGLMSARWRAATSAAVGAAPGMAILDLAAGTGTSTRPYAAAGALAVPVDLSLGMLAVGKSRSPELPFVAGDGLALPFDTGVFDAVTISFGLRNVEDVDAALTELRRVTKPGGRLVIAEVSTPTWGPFRRAYAYYLRTVLPGVARVASSNIPAYGYLAESIRAWPDQRRLAAAIAGAGWVEVSWKNLAGGIVAIHRAVAP